MISFYAIRFILIFTVVCSLVDLGSGDWKRTEHHYYANSIDQTSRTLDVITIAKFEYAGISERPDPMFGISGLMASLIGMSFEIYVLVICIVLSACLVACIGQSYSNRSGALRSWVWFGISLVVLSCHSPSLKQMLCSICVVLAVNNVMLKGIGLNTIVLLVLASLFHKVGLLISIALLSAIYLPRPALFAVSLGVAVLGLTGTSATIYPIVQSGLYSMMDDWGIFRYELGQLHRYDVGVTFPRVVTWTVATVGMVAAHFFGGRNLNITVQACYLLISLGVFFSFLPYNDRIFLASVILLFVLLNSLEIDLMANKIRCKFFT